MNAVNWRRVQTGIGVGFLLGLVFLVGYLGVRAVTEPERIKAAVNRELATDCEFFGGVVEAPVPPTATELGRRIVRSAKRSYDNRGCAEMYGEVRVDPEAYKPAPPMPSRSR